MAGRSVLDEVARNSKDQIQRGIMKSTMLRSCLLLALLASLATQAAPPRTLSYQGVLTNAAAVPVNAGQTIVFSLYDVPSGGTALWTETQSVTVANGLFAVTLGGITPITLQFDVTYYLGVKVGTDAEMLPRQALASSAYAITALGLDASAVVPGATVVGPITAVASGGGPLTLGNTVIGLNAMPYNTGGAENTVIGAEAEFLNLGGGYNTIVGRQAHHANQFGSYNTAVGWLALATATSSNNIAIGASAGVHWTTGGSNIAIGNTGRSGDSNTIRLGDPNSHGRAFIGGVFGVTPVFNVRPVVIDADGQLGTSNIASTVREPGAGNTFAGTGAGNLALTGEGNVAFGKDALPAVNTGIWNAATGYRAMLLNQEGSFNTANGLEALANNISGGNNTAVGVRALLNSNADGNIAIGANAGASLTTGSGNIAIGHAGVAAESDTTRIGTSQTRAFMAGINGVTSSGGVPVFINSAGQLGTLTSSARFKENITAMDDASADLMRLNPVTFNYLDGQDDGQKLTQYGLIAEEVAEVYPDLVVKTPDGKAETVRYHFLTPMLLNEVQKQQRKLVAQADELAAQRDKVAALERELAAIKAMLTQR